MIRESDKSTVSYTDMVNRYGNAAAFDLLLSVEKLAKIEDGLALADEETRFQRALEVLSQTNVAA